MVVSTRYFQPASRALRLPLWATSSADAAVVASTSSQASPRLEATGTASNAAQKRWKPSQYQRRARAGAKKLRSLPSRYAGETSALSSPTAAITARKTPLAVSTSTTKRRPARRCGRARGVASVPPAPAVSTAPVRPMRWSSGPAGRAARQGSRDRQADREPCESDDGSVTQTPQPVRVAAASRRRSAVNAVMITTITSKSAQLDHAASRPRRRWPRARCRSPRR